MLVIKGKRKEIYKNIKNNSEETIALIKVKPSIHLLAKLLSETKVKKIYFTPGILKTVSPKVLEAIRKIHVDFQIYTVKKGPPYKRNIDVIENVLSLIRKGNTICDACKKIKIPRRTFYYRIKKRGIKLKKVKKTIRL